MLELAKKLYNKNIANIYLFALEHRYYGKSFPKLKENNNTNNLLYLSSKQALMDIRHFVITTMNTKFTDIDNDTKWITFGGSYPGFLSAMVRQFYPNIIYGAVSSSAPVRFVIDFKSYKEHQAYDLQYNQIGGNQQCLQIIRDGHTEIEYELIIKENYNTVGTMFRICNASSTFLHNKDNINMFLGDGVVDIPAQGNNPSCNTSNVCNIEQTCQFLLQQQKQQQSSSSSNMELLAKLATLQQQNDDDNDHCMTID